jgi:thiamine pyrophosphokinase
MKNRLGIIFTGGEGPPPHKLKRLLEDSAAAGALLVAANSGLLLAESAGLKPDWIVGDMDSLGSVKCSENRNFTTEYTEFHGESRKKLLKLRVPPWFNILLGQPQDPLRSYPPERVIRHAADKDFSDTELALDLLWEKGCDEAWIAGGGGGRIAHLLGIRDLFERERFPRRWITAAEDIYCIEGDSLTLTLKQGDLVSVFPLGGGPWKAHSTGLKWPLDNVRWERGLYGLSNVALEPEMTINALQGRFIIITEEGCRHT